MSFYLTTEIKRYIKGNYLQNILSLIIVINFTNNLLLAHEQLVSRCYVQAQRPVDCGFIRCCENHFATFGSVGWTLDSDKLGLLFVLFHRGRELNLHHEIMITRAFLGQESPTEVRFGMIIMQLNVEGFTSLHLNQMLHYALCLSYNSNTEAILFACLSSGWATTTSRLLGTKVRNSI